MTFSDKTSVKYLIDLDFVVILKMLKQFKLGLHVEVRAVSIIWSLVIKSSLAYKRLLRTTKIVRAKAFIAEGNSSNETVLSKHKNRSNELCNIIKYVKSHKTGVENNRAKQKQGLNE